METPKLTPIAKAISKFQTHYDTGENLNDKSEREVGYSACLKHAMQILTELLPAERQMVENAYRVGGHDWYVHKFNSEVYFENNLKQ